MYRKKTSRQLEFVDFYMPFSGKLSAENRWLKLAEIIPWELTEEIYAEAFCEDFGAPALSVRVTLGELLIKEREGLTDRGTVEMILRRNLNQIEKLLQNPNAASLTGLSKRQYKSLLVCHEVRRGAHYG